MVKSKGTNLKFSPKNSFDRARLISEMKLVGDFGLRNKKELRIVERKNAEIKKRASKLIVTNDTDELIVCGRALLSKLLRDGIYTSDIDFSSIESIKMNLEKVLDLQISDFLERRLQSQVYRLGLARSVHQARKFISQRYIAVNSAVVDCPSFIIRSENDGYITFSDKYKKMDKKREARRAAGVVEE